METVLNSGKLSLLRVSAQISHLQSKAVPCLSGGHSVRASVWLLGMLFKTKKGLGTGGQQHLSGRARQTFCPGKTKWFDMFCTLTRIQKKGVSLQWHHPNPIVAE